MTENHSSHHLALPPATTTARMMINTSKTTTLSVVKFNLPNHDNNDHPTNEEPPLKLTSPHSIGKTSTKKLSIFTSSKTSTSRHSTLRIRTCCGVLEFDCMRVVSILALIFNVCAFAVIAGVIIHSFSVINNPRADILSLRGDALYNCLLMEEATRHASYANNLTAAKLWYQYRDAMVDALSGIFDVLQQSGSTINISTLVDPVKKDPMVIPIIQVEQQIISLVENGRPLEAKKLFISNASFISSYTGKVFQNFLNVLKTDGRFKDQIINSTSITTVSVVGTNLTLIIPVMFVIFLLTIKRDKDASKKLRQAELLLLKDTIANGGLRTLFRNFIVEKAEGSRNLRLLNQYMFLEKVQYYKDLNLKLFEIQIKMERQEFEKKRQVKSPQLAALQPLSSETYDDLQEENRPLGGSSDNESRNIVMHNHNTFNENCTQQVENDWDSPELALIFPELNTHVVFSQQDIDKIEREKYEVAFEIFSEHLDEKTAGDCHIGGLSKKMIQEVRQVLDAINHGQDLELKHVENEGTSVDQLKKHSTKTRLSDALFDPLQEKVAERLLTLYKQFKQQLALGTKTSPFRKELSGQVEEI